MSLSAGEESPPEKAAAGPGAASSAKTKKPGAVRAAEGKAASLSAGKEIPSPDAAAGPGAAPSEGTEKPGAARAAKGGATVPPSGAKDPPPAEAAARSGGGPRPLRAFLLPVALAAAALVAVGGAGAYLHSRIAALEDRLAEEAQARSALEGELDDARAEAGRTGERLGGEVARIGQELDGVPRRGEVEALEQRFRQGLDAVRGEIGDMALSAGPGPAAEEMLARIGAVGLAGEEGRARSRDEARALGLAAVAARIRRRAEAGLPLGREARLAAALGAGADEATAAALAALELHAESLPSPPALLRALPGIARPAPPEAGGEAGGGAGLLDGALSWLGRMVVIRRVSAPGGDTPAAALARAVLAAEAGDLRGAHGALSGLADPLPAGIGEWRAAAASAVAVLDAADALEEAAFARLAALASGEGAE